MNIPVSEFNQSLTHIKHSVITSIKAMDNRFKADLSFLVVSRIT